VCAGLTLHEYAAVRATDEPHGHGEGGEESARRATGGSVQRTRKSAGAASQATSLCSPSLPATEYSRYRSEPCRAQLTNPRRSETYRPGNRCSSISLLGGIPAYIYSVRDKTYDRGGRTDTVYTFPGGPVHSGHFVFLRCAGRLSDGEVLNVLGLQGWVAVEEMAVASRGAVKITEDAAWIHVADNLSYTILHEPDFDELLRMASLAFDVFSCWAGDSDQSYGFALYRGGEVVRRKVVDASDWLRYTMTNVGKRLPGEIPWCDWRDGLRIGLALARRLGIDTDHSARSLRGYSYQA